MSAALDIREAEPTTLLLSEITLDKSLLLREVDDETAKDYAEAFTRKAVLPPVVVMRLPDQTYVLCDGQHRYRACEIAGRDRIAVVIKEGDRAAAILASASSNDAHGKPRTIEHRKAAVLALCNEPFYKNKSDRWIAQACRVSPSFVGDIRKDIRPTVHTDTSGHESENRPAATMGRDGKIRKAPKKPKRKPFNPTRQVKALARLIDNKLAKKWPADVPAVALVDLLLASAAKLEASQAKAVA